MVFLTQAHLAIEVVIGIEQNLLVHRPCLGRCRRRCPICELSIGLYRITPHGSIFILQKAFIELFGNFIYHNMNIFTGGAYAPCMGTPLAHRQREWDLRYADKVWTGLLESTSAPRDRARLLASGAPHSGDWMLDPPVRIAVALRLGNNTLRTAFVPPLPR